MHLTEWFAGQRDDVKVYVRNLEPRFTVRMLETAVSEALHRAGALSAERS